jgi:hypothetical protein
MAIIMNELEERAKSQLMIIENMYGIRIQKKDEVTNLIAGSAENSRQILRICSFLNSWLAMSGARGDVSIPADTLKKAIMLSSGSATAKK